MDTLNLMDMEAQLVATLGDSQFKADIYSLSMPGEFRVVYRDSSGKVLEEGLLTGISTYKQREPEILARLHELAQGAEPSPNPDRGDPGEY
jgi:hypothetical protein